MTTVSFSAALAALKLGLRVKRHWWKAYLSLSGGVNRKIMVCPLDGNKKVQWHNQDVDLLAEDWEIIPDGDIQK